MSVQVAISPQTSIVVVHDVVNDFVDPSAPEYDPGLDPMLENIKTLLAAARKAGIPVAFIGPGQGDPSIPPAHPAANGRLVWGTPGVDVVPSLGPLQGDRVVRKPRWGGFF